MNDFGKARILLKYQWEGDNLSSFMDWGIPTILWNEFADQFKVYYDAPQPKALKNWRTK